MRAMPIGVRLEEPAKPSSLPARGRGPALGDREWLKAEDRQLERMLVAGFLLCLVPAAAASLTGWRWSPWPAGPQGRGSIVHEARAAAEAYVPLAFMGW